jgi:uncharacterized membrane protein (DUF2068 family)
MWFVPRGWSSEIWVCSMRGHCIPAAEVAHVRPEDRELGIDTADGRRLSRCLRCDAWIESWPPSEGEARHEFIPPFEQLDLPRRDKPLRDAIVIRLIAIDRAIHSVIFGLLAIALTLIDTNFGSIQSFAHDNADRLDDVASNTGPHASHDALSRELHRLADIDRGTVTVLAVTAAVYAIVEGVEAVGLWRERRWAEYLTVVATAGFLPFEIRELIDKVSVLRIGALVVNLAIVAWLVWSKRLFGLRGGAAALHDDIDWSEVLQPPPPALRT